MRLISECFQRGRWYFILNIEVVSQPIHQRIWLKQDYERGYEVKSERGEVIHREVIHEQNGVNVE